MAINMDMMDELLIDMTLLVEHDDNMTSLVSHVKHWSVQAAGQQPRATYAYSTSQARTVTVEGRRVRVLVEEANSPDQVLLDFIRILILIIDMSMVVC